MWGRAGIQAEFAVGAFVRGASIRHAARRCGVEIKSAGPRRCKITVDVDNQIGWVGCIEANRAFGAGRNDGGIGTHSAIERVEGRYKWLGLTGRRDRDIGEVPTMIR